MRKLSTTGLLKAKIKRWSGFKLTQKERFFLRLNDNNYEGVYFSLGDKTVSEEILYEEANKVLDQLDIGEKDGKINSN